MKKGLILVCLACFHALVSAQNEVPTVENGAQRILNTLTDQKVTLGGYGQIDYNQQLSGNTRYNGKLDVHRLVLLFGYQFSDKVKMVTELEVEHVNEVYIEQAFINYQIKPWLTFNGGLLLIPMGIINEYHEPTTFNGVERPNVDNVLVPTTWREIGMGFSGVIPSIQIKYQAYVVNGFKSYQSNAGILGGASPMRGGRQKGINAIVSHPNFSGKLDYFGIRGLQLGLSVYAGKTQSDLYHKLNKDNETARAKADSSVVGTTMVGLDARYQWKGVQLRGQFIYQSLSNVDAYNAFTKKDLGEAMSGGYFEVAYNLLSTNRKTTHELTPFVRYEHYNTHQKAEVVKEQYQVDEIVAGIGFKVARGVVFKADYQWQINGLEEQFHYTNLGIGFWF